jgi:hypothetical protein
MNIFRIFPHKHNWKYRRLEAKRVCMLCGKEQQKTQDSKWVDTLFESHRKKSWWLY